MSEEPSKADRTHPGEVEFEDQIENRSWTRPAAELPETMQWVDLEEGPEPVTRIEITGTAEHRRFTKFGPKGKFLESTIQASPPPRRPSSREERPQIIPGED